ncbi:MAG: DUF2029 domain-containing protein [Planctomycetes bacterium]|nr:DUF2029 domain-containing protein [Planctomycetota bacterium]
MFALVQALHKARKGQCAILKWRPALEALERGETIYGRDEQSLREGFPTPPTTALALRPFLALDDAAAGVCWALFKLALAWWMIVECAKLAAGRLRDYPPWALVALVAIVARVVLSDIAHGNINLPVAACVVASARSWARGDERAAGLWAALGATLKLTPALLLVYFAWRRSPRAVFWMVLGVVLFAYVLPGAVLGYARQGELLSEWQQQMVAPYASGAALTRMQTEQTNQSLTGVLGRILTDSVAIVARPPHWPDEVRLNGFALTHDQFRIVFYVAAASVLAFVAYCTRGPRSPRNALGDFALVSLAMLLLSERSWKQHYVTLILPVAFVLLHAVDPATAPSGKKRSFALLGAAVLLTGFTGEGLLGERLSDLAEALGAWCIAALALLVATGLALRERRLAP